MASAWVGNEPPDDVAAIRARIREYCLTDVSGDFLTLLQDSIVLLQRYDAHTAELAAAQHIVAGLRDAIAAELAEIEDMDEAMFAGPYIDGMHRAAQDCLDALNRIWAEKRSADGGPHGAGKE